MDLPQTLVFGFGPYLEFEDNVTEAIIENIPASPGLVTEVYDVRFSRRMFLDSLIGHRPSLIIGLGQHPRARKLRLERRAVNMMRDPGRPGRSISAKGPAVRRVNLRLPNSRHTTVTYDAGSYVCNFSMYMCLEYCEKYDARFGFIHVPRYISPSLVTNYVRKALQQVWIKR